MSVLDQERMDKIKQYLKWNPRGMTISDVSSKMHMNRNLVAKYLDMLLISGQVDMQEIGAAKVYFLSHCVPISAMLDFSSDMVIVLDNENRILKANEPMLAALNEDRASIVGRCMDDPQNPFLIALKSHMPPPGSQDISDQINEMRCTLEEKECHLRVKRIPTVFEDGNRGITLIIENITDQVAYQERLKMSEARYRGIIEDQTEFIIRITPDDTATFVNAAYARYLETNVEHLIGKPFLPGIHDGDTHIRDEAFLSLSCDHPVSTFECRIDHPSGQVHWNTWTIRAFFDASGFLSECQGVGRDITEKREAAAKINNYIRGMEFLSQTCMAFMDMHEEDDIYDYTVRQINSLAPGLLAWINILNEPARNIVLKSIVGNFSVEKIAGQPPGMHFPGMTFPIIKADQEELIRYKCLAKIPPLSRLLQIQLPKEVLAQVTEATGGVDTYLMGLVTKGRLIGNAGICHKSGSPLPTKDLIEALIRQAAIAIDRRMANDTLKASLAREREQVQNLQFLSRTAMDFIEMEDSEDIYRYIADRLYDLIPESIIGINSFDPGQKELTLRAVAGKEDQLNTFWEGLGIANPLGLSFPISELPQLEIDFCKSTLFEVPSLYDILFHQIPEKRCRKAQEELYLGKGFCMGFSRKSEIFGNILIELVRPDDITNREIVEAFVNQASVALLRRFARERHRESEQLLQVLLEQMPYPVVILDRDEYILDANGLAAALIGCSTVAALSGSSFREYMEGGTDLPPGLLRCLVSYEGSDLSCRLRLRSSGKESCEVEAWGRMIRYNRKPALYVVLRPLSAEMKNGGIRSSMSGVSGTP